MQLTIAYSPCPNDTFMFHGLASGGVEIPGCQVAVELHDVETLNQLALQQRFDVSKLSFYGWLLGRRHYRLLRCGAALGFGCGPLLVARRPIAVEELPGCCIALPGELTTAHLLFRLWQPQATNRIFVPYHEIFARVAGGEADCGVVIHESRFTFQEHGLHCLADLGQWWEQETGLPIPLGCIAAHHRLGESVIAEVERAIAESIARAQADPAATRSYMQEHAQEMQDAVLDQHVQTFVNRYSVDLGEDGAAAVRRLEEMAVAAGVIR